MQPGVEGSIPSSSNHLFQVLNLIERECLNCSKKFNTEQKYLNRGHGKFCSLSCARKNSPRKSSKIEIECSWCKIKFMMAPSRLRSKSGLNFCCREHKDLAQRIGGLKEIQLPHYGNQLASYRTKVLREAIEIKCARCGYDKYPEILEVHHKDCNRENNNLENLELICPNCHQEEHFKTKTGRWRK